MNIDDQDTSHRRSQRLFPAPHELASPDSRFSAGLLFRVPDKKTGKRYLTKALAYTGPDKATVELLTNRHAGRKQNPATIYLVATSPIPVHLLDPEAQILGSCLLLEEINAHLRILRRCHCIVLENLRQKRGPQSAQTIAPSLREAKICPILTLLDLTEVAETLIDAGSRYIWIKEYLRVRSVFLLGQDVPDLVYAISPQEVCLN